MLRKYPNAFTTVDLNSIKISKQKQKTKPKTEG